MSVLILFLMSVGMGVTVFSAQTGDNTLQVQREFLPEYNEYDHGERRPVYTMNNGGRRPDFNRQNLSEYIKWSVYSEIPPLPGEEHQPGLAGTFSGTINDHLVIAGGASFPDTLSCEEGLRRYKSDVYILSLDGRAEWSVRPGALPRELGYGVSVTLSEGILLIGGANADEVYSDVFLMTLSEVGNAPVFTEWPGLPVPLTRMTGTLVDHKIYIAGGRQELENPSATNHFFVLDIRNKERGWQRLDPWPGPPRSFALSAGQSDGFDNAFYLFSGKNYGPDTPLEVLSDGYKYNPRLDTWSRLDSPEDGGFPVMAGMAFPSGENHIIFLGGDDETRLDNHTGFSRDVLYYHTITNTLTIAGQAPFDIPLTANVIHAQDKFFIIGGEIRPGLSTPGIWAGEFVTIDRSFGLFNMLVIAAYFGLLVWMGWFFSKRQKNTNDYFRGGSNMPWWVVGLSIFGTALSAITFMALPAKSYATDWSYIILNAGIVAVAPIIIILCIPFYRKLDITTAYQYLEQRFNVAARLVGSLSFILFQIGRMGVVLFLPAIAINVVTGMDIFLCIALMGVFSLLYTMMGGIMAVIWTDALQVVVLLGGAVLAVIIISSGVEGGFMEIISKGAEQNKFHLGDARADLQNPTLLTLFLAALFINLVTYGTDQTMVQRYVTTPTQKMAAKSIWTNALMTIPGSLIFFFVGTALYVFYSYNPLQLSPVITGGDSIFPWFIFTQMPPGVSGLLIAGVFAASMSTLSSSMNSAATAYSVDIHSRLGWSNKLGGLRLARIATLILGLAGIAAGLMMATWDIKSLWDEFQRILGLILGGVGGLFFLGLLTKKAHGTGAMIGLAGSVIVQIWVSQSGAVHLLLFAATGFVSCFLIGYIASLLTPQYRKDISHLTIYSFWNTS